MRICDQRWAEALGEGLSWMPSLLHRFERVEILAGVDPVFVGRHDNEDAGDGRSYRRTNHVSYPWNANAKNVAMVLASDDPNEHTVIHEFGHILDFQLYEQTGKWGPDFSATCEYAGRDRWEAFACAFHSWFFSPRAAAEGMHGWGGYDRESREFFDRLTYSGW